MRTRLDRRKFIKASLGGAAGIVILKDSRSVGAYLANATAKPFSNFDIGSPQTEMVQLIQVAALAGKPIEYDPLTGKITNVPEANALLHREYRAGWTF